MPIFQAVPLDPHQAPATPSLAPLRGLTTMRWNPTRNSMVGQDTLVGSARRTIFAFGLKGRATWPWDATDLVGSWPDEDEWRRVWGPLDVRLTPGSFLALRVLYVPSGLTQIFDGESDVEATPSGAVRVGVAWSNAATAASESLTYYELELETDDGGALPTGDGAHWDVQREDEIGLIAPTEAQAGGPAGLADWSEGTVATVRIEIRGGARIVDAVLYESPAPKHVTRHDDTFPVSVHGAHVAGLPPAVPQTIGPQEAKASPGFTERRFGTQQVMRTAERQTAKLGPHVLSWSPWASDEDSYVADPSGEVVPFELTGTAALTELVDAASSAYDADRGGWVVAASYAQLHRYSEPVQVLADGGVAVIPARVQVRARWTGASGFGLVRFQSSDTEWIDVEFPNTGTLETIEIIGWLETQAAADQATAVFQVLLQNNASGDTLELFGFAVEWGWSS